MDLSNIDIFDSFEKAEDFLEETPAQEAVENKKEEVPVEEPQETLEEAPEETQEGIQEETQEEYEESIISQIKAGFGFDIEGEFTEDVEGLKNLTTEAARRLALQDFQDIFDSYPDVADYMRYRMNGGDPDKFIKANNTSIDSIEEVTDENSKDIVSTYLKTMGFDENDIKETIEDYEDTGILEKQAKKVLPKIKEHYKKEKEALIQQQEQERQAEIENANKYWESVRETVKAGKIKNIAIPEADKKKFFDWLAVPVENNKSKRDIQREAMELEDQLALEYLMYKNLDISNLVISKNQTKKAQDLKKLLTNKGNKLSGGNPTTRKKDNQIGSIDSYLF